MTPRTLLAAAAIAAAAGVVEAAEPTTMTVWQNGVEQETKKVCDNTELTFANGGFTYLYASDQEGVTFELTNDTEITFFVDQAGVKSVTADKADFALRTNPVGATLELTGDLSAPTLLEIYAIQGARVVALNNWQGEPVNVTALPPGMYILKINNQTLKFIKS